MQVRGGKREDAKRFSDLVLLAAPFFSELFGEDEARALLQYLYRCNSNLFGYSHSWFAEEENTLGMIYGYDYRTKMDEQVKTGYLMLRGLGFSFFRVIPPLLKLDAQVSRIEKGQFYIAFLAVYHDFQGHGIGSVLLDFADKRALSLGDTSVCLDVEEENTKAFRVYEHKGFKSERSYSIRLNSHLELHFIRMKKELAD